MDINFAALKERSLDSSLTPGKLIVVTLFGILQFALASSLVIIIVIALCSLTKDTAICSINSQCVRNITADRFYCKCNLGYKGDEQVCVDVNECAVARIHDCKNREGHTCLDINECQDHTHNCHKDADCINKPGSYACSCKKGFTGNGQYCSDVDECTPGLQDCHADAFCTNLPGTYNCTCKWGYQGDGKVCSDINECLSNKCDDNSKCVNTNGSYYCKCHHGYKKKDFHSCENINECAVFPCDKNAHCIDTSGSYICNCNPGYSGDGNNYCRDVDECQLTNSCHTHAICFNTEGNYTCNCNHGYHGNGLICKKNASMVISKSTMHLIIACVLVISFLVNIIF